MKRCIALFNDGWADWEAGPVLAVLREHFGWTIKIATPQGDDTESIGGIRARADMSFDEVDPAQANLILAIGSEQWFLREQENVYDLLRKAVAKNVPVGAICAATLAAARAGILDDRDHTSNSANFLKENAPKYKGDLHYKNVAAAVENRGVITACGDAPITFAAEVIRLVEPTKAELADQYLSMMRAEHS